MFRKKLFQLTTEEILQYIQICKLIILKNPRASIVSFLALNLFIESPPRDCFDSAQDRLNAVVASSRFCRLYNEFTTRSPQGTFEVEGMRLAIEASIAMEYDPHGIAATRAAAVQRDLLTAIQRQNLTPNLLMYAQYAIDSIYT